MIPVIPRSIFLWLDVNLPASVFLRESAYGYAAMLTSHVVTMGIFFGLILMMDLRLLWCRQPAFVVLAAPEIAPFRGR